MRFKLGIEIVILPMVSYSGCYARVLSIWYLDLSFQGHISKLKLCFNLNTIDNHCAKYEHPRSIDERGVHFTSCYTYLKNI